MSKFRKYFVAVFATLLAVAASATDVPYGKNLLQNTNPDGTTFDPWVLTKNSGSGWAISDGKFLSSYKECVLKQTVNLKDLGLTTEQTDSLTMLSMVNYEIPWPGGNNCIAKVIITCKDSAGNNLSKQSLLDINQSNLEVSATLATKPFLLPEGTTQLVYEMHGKDQVGWGGQYGPRFWGMYVGFVDLTKTYTASAVASLGDSLVFSQTDGIKALDTLTVASKYSDVRIKSISSENSGVISSNQAICTGADMSINAEFYRKHSIIASASEYGTITIKKDMAFYGDTIVVSHTMNSDTVLFAGYTTTPDINWLNDSTFIMVDEDVTIGMEIYRKHSIVVSASEYGTITIKKDTAFCGDTITVSHTMNSDTVRFAGYTTTPNVNWLNDSTFIMVDEDVTIGMKVYRKHSVVASASEYGTITVNRDAALCGDTIVVSHTMNGDTVSFVDYTTTPDITWLNDSTFIMVDEDVTIGMKAYRKHSVVASASEYGTITVNRDAAFCGDTIVVSHTMNGDTVLFGGYTTTPDVTWLNGSTFIMVDEDVTIGMHAGYDKNLLQNTNPNGTTYDPWVKTNKGSGWFILNGKFLSSYGECVLTQTVNLKDLGFTTGQTDSLAMLAMVNYEIPWPGSTHKCIAKVIVTCKDAAGNTLSVQTLLDINQKNIEVSATVATKLFLLPKGTTQLVYEMHGQDQVDWAGQYGPVFWGMYLGFTDLKNYTITIAECENGSVVSNKATAQIGDTVKLTITPDSDFDLDKLVITQGETQVNFNAEDSTFVMLVGDVTITATFKQSTDVEDVKVLNLYVADGRIYCEGEFRIFDLLGRDVTAMNGSLRGVYLVRTKDAFRKVIVK